MGGYRERRGQGRRTPSGRRRALDGLSATRRLSALIVAGLLASGLAACSKSDDGGSPARETSDTADSGSETGDTTGTPDTGETGETGETVPDSSGPADTIAPAGLAADEGMVLIEGSTFTIGADDPAISVDEKNAESPAEDVDVATFYIDVFEVTNQNYRNFAEEFQAPPAANWTSQGFPADEADMPVQGVAFEWAQAYCAALGKRLPTEIEWEVAASGTDRRPFPWGTDAGAGGLPDEGHYPAGSVETNISPFGVYDLAGNAWEWVSDTYGKFVPSNQRVLRGGENGWLRKNTLRLPIDPLTSNAATKAGFRCASNEVDPARPQGEFGELDTLPAPVTPQTPELPDGYIMQEQFVDSASGWVEQTQDAFRFGYHPNSFFHLEAKQPGVEVIATAPTVLVRNEAVTIVATVLVDAPNTSPDGTFEYGIATRLGDSRAGILFVIDPRNSEWRVYARDALGGIEVLQKASRSFRETDRVELKIEQRVDDMAFFINGARVWGATIPGFDGLSTGLYVRNADDSPKVHIHFDTFDILELN